MIDAGSRKQVGLDWVDKLGDERSQSTGDTAAQAVMLRALLRNVVTSVPHIAARRYDRDLLWVLVGLITGTGKRDATALCLQFGWNPDATVRACRLGKGLR